jgi:diguanylate cyclase (GGDEF)-like protein
VPGDVARALTGWFADRPRREVLALIAFVLVGYVIAVQLDLFDLIHSFAEEHEDWELDEVFGALIIATVGLSLFGVGRARATVRELSKRVEAEDNARRLAMHDMLTGLANRRHLHQMLDLKTADRSGPPFALIAIDLDRFKPVNDLYGHAVGDELLIRIARLLQQHCGPEGFVARLGGDEFVVLVSSVDGDKLIAWLSTLVSEFETPFALNGTEASVGATMGIALFPSDGTDPDTLLRRADVALYRAKEEGGGQFAFFETGMDERVHERAALENDLRIAVRSDQIEPHFQPLVHLGSNQIRGYEILARWKHPQRGNIPPDQFIPVAEGCGLIGDLTLNVLRRACKETLGMAGGPRIALNISPVQLHDSGLPQRLLKVLEECGFPPGRLEVEITEAALVSDFESAREILFELKRHGVHIALDDFGTGYSSLRHLRELPFDVLKIDRSFIKNMDETHESWMLVRTIVSLARNLGLGVIAEGIETAKQAHDLEAIGCEMGQGYHFGKPEPYGRIIDTLTVSPGDLDPLMWVNS